MIARAGLLSVILALSAGFAGSASGNPVQVAKAPVVSAGVAGKRSQMFAPRLITARSTTVKVGGRSCGVAAGTPLAALAALRRIGGPRFTLRDYGSCTAKPANSGSLFVTSIGGVRNKGQNGWVYKVNGKTGTTGAADPTGPFGSGTLGGGEKVRWFWCDLAKRGRC